MVIKIASDVCRTCLQRNSTISMLDDEQLMNKFIEVTQIEIQSNDGLPNKICIECVVKLKTLYNFKMQCKSIDNHLKSFVRQVESKFDELIVLKKCEFDIKSNTLTMENTINCELDKIIDYNEYNEEIIMDFNDFIIEEKVDVQQNDEHQCQTDEIVVVKMENVQENDVEKGNVDESFVDAKENDDKYENIVIEDEVKNIFDENHVDDEENVDKNSKQQQNDIIFEKIIESSQYEKSIANETIIQLSIDSTATLLCHLCNKDFTNRSNLARHIKEHEGTKRFVCDICHASFTQKASLKVHMIRHSRMFPYFCELCRKSFARPNQYTGHMRRHTDIKPFQCNECNEMFTLRTSLNAHKANVHNVSPVLYACPICGKVLKSQRTYEMHTKRHQNDKLLERKKLTKSEQINDDDNSQCANNDKKTLTFKCSYCNKHFKRQKELNVHLAKHSNRKFRCKRCNETFIGDLHLHMKQHKHEKSFNCTDCSKTFQYKESLKRHLQMHTIETETNNE